MGSITSRSKAPPAPRQQIVYVPAPTAQPSPSLSEPEPNEADAENRAAIRRSNLLTRSRGRVGTVTTSFRGLLGGQNQSGSAGKTLLGE